MRRLAAQPLAGERGQRFLGAADAAAHQLVAAEQDHMVAAAAHQPQLAAAGDFGGVDRFEGYHVVVPSFNAADRAPKRRP